MSITSRRGFLGAMAVSGADARGVSGGGRAPDKLQILRSRKDTDIACVDHALRRSARFCSCSPHEHHLSVL